MNGQTHSLDLSDSFFDLFDDSARVCSLEHHRHAGHDFPLAVSRYSALSHSSTANNVANITPIYLHPHDDFNISGKVIAVIKRPSLNVTFQIPASIRITHETLSPKRCVSNLNPK